jgi:hypothetical protein
LVEDDNFVDDSRGILSNRRRLRTSHDCLQLRARLFGESPAASGKSLCRAIKRRWID